MDTSTTSYVIVASWPCAERGFAPNMFAAVLSVENGDSVRAAIREAITSYASRVGVKVATAQATWHQVGRSDADADNRETFEISNGEKT